MPKVNGINVSRKMGNLNIPAKFTPERVIAANVPQASLKDISRFPELLDIFNQTENPKNAGRKDLSRPQRAIKRAIEYGKIENSTNGYKLFVDIHQVALDDHKHPVTVYGWFSKLAQFCHKNFPNVKVHKHEGGFLTLAVQK